MKIEFKKRSNNDTLLEFKYLYNYRKSWNYFELDSFKRAFKHIDMCIGLLPEYTGALIKKMDMHLEMKDFRSAEADMKNLEKLRPGENYINYYWGIFFQEQKNILKQLLLSKNVLKRRKTMLRFITVSGIVTIS
jgi:hypothetical protein